MVGGYLATIHGNVLSGWLVKSPLWRFLAKSLYVIDLGKNFVIVFIVDVKSMWYSEKNNNKNIIDIKYTF